MAWPVAIIFAFIDWIYQFFRRIVRIAAPQSTPPTTSSFADRFDAKFGDTHPVFFEGTFKQLLERAKHDYKLLLVYLHSEHHQNTDHFCRNVLCTDGVKAFVDENFLFWATDISTPDGYQLSDKFHATTYPFLVVLCVINSRIDICAKIEGEMQVESLVNTLTDTVERWQPQLVAQQADDLEREQRRLQREEQDRAYHMALERDRQREEEQRLEEQRAREAAEAAERAVREREARIETIRNWKTARRQTYPAEPAAGSADTALIRFRFPNGLQLERRFSVDDKIELLYEFVHLLEEGKQNWAPHPESTLESYELTTTFPKTKLEPHTTLRDCSITRNAIVMVHEQLPMENV